VSGIRIFHLLDVTLSGNETLTGGSFGPEASAVLTAIGVVLTLILWRGMWRRGPVSAGEDAKTGVPG
jgi:hypothetical protein